MSQYNQSLRHQSFRDIASTEKTYNEDAYEAFLCQGATAVEWEGAFIEWLQIQTCTTKDNVEDLKAEFAINVVGVSEWDHVGTFDTTSFVSLEDGCILKLEDGCHLKLES